MLVFSRENAAQMAAKGLMARRANRERKRNLEQTLADLAAGKRVPLCLERSVLE